MKNKTRKKLRMKMIEKDMLYYDLAKKTKVSSVQISRIVNGHSNGSIEWWENAAKALECDVSEII